MEMKITDLRIGSYIKNVLGIAKVEEIYLRHGIYKIHARYLDEIDIEEEAVISVVQDFNDWKPIELNDQMLLRIGFGYDPVLRERHWVKENKWAGTDGIYFYNGYLCLPTETNGRDTCEWIGPKIEFVHQLQNKWIEATGEELKLVAGPCPAIAGT